MGFVPSFSRCTEGRHGQADIYRCLRSLEDNSNFALESMHSGARRGSTLAFP